MLKKKLFLPMIMVVLALALTACTTDGDIEPNPDSPPPAGSEVPDYDDETPEDGIGDEEAPEDEVEDEEDETP